MKKMFQLFMLCSSVLLLLFFDSTVNLTKVGRRAKNLPSQKFHPQVHIPLAERMNIIELPYVAQVHGFAYDDDEHIPTVEVLCNAVIITRYIVLTSASCIHYCRK